MPESWPLLTCTAPVAPSRKRATIWRASKRAGAAYRRDDTAAIWRAIAAKVAISRYLRV